ncbi:MAG: hypothetical protein AVO33_08510 [delta proteobacterium ML8_F1]|nr:MAG: hypothetical protein AVO33_08510 [delta proteobacterium ML8_F1]
MKAEKILGIGLALVIAVFLVMNFMALGGLALDKDEVTNTLSVQGSGEVNVQPDTAIINIGLETRDSNAAAAQEKNNVIMEEVVAAMKTIGIDSKDIKTEYYNMYRGYDHNTNTEQELYIVNNTLKITVREIENVGQAIDTAVDLGANQVNSIQFTLSDDAELYKEALAKALTDAGEKAEQLAQSTGRPLKGIVSIVENTNQSPVMYDYGYSREAAAASPIETGELQVRATVQVVYEH